jgi:hypothetical protein
LAYRATTAILTLAVVVGIGPVTMAARTAQVAVL